MVSRPWHSPSRVLPFCVAVVVVVALSTVAYSGKIPSLITGHGIDKVVHGAMGATLTFLLARALRGRAVLAALLVLVPLATDEYLQRFSPMRSSDWGDLAADVAGALLAIALTASAVKSRSRTERNASIVRARAPAGSLHGEGATCSRVGSRVSSSTRRAATST
jgi:VanZ family protein